MIFTKLWSLEKKLPKMCFDETTKPLEGKKVLMTNGPKSSRSAGVFHSIVTYVISTITAIFFLLLMLTAIFQVNICVTCLAGYPQLVKNKMSSEDRIISNYDNHTIRDNASKVDTVTTESAVTNTGTALAIKLNEPLKNLENLGNDREDISAVQDTLTLKMTTHINNESLTNFLKNIPHNNYSIHDKVSDGKNKTKSSIDADKYGLNDKNVEKDLSENLSDVEILTTSGLDPNTETTVIMNLKEHSKHPQQEMDKAEIILLQEIPPEKMATDEKHDSITNIMKNNPSDKNPDHDKVSEGEYTTKSPINVNKHDSNNKKISKEFPENFSNLGVITTSGLDPNTEKTLLMNLKEHSKDPQKLEMDQTKINLLQETLSEKIAKDKNHESITNIMKNNPHEKYSDHHKVSKDENITKSPININRHDSTDKNIIKELPDSIPISRVMATSGTDPNTERSLLMNLKDELENPQKLGIDQALIFLLQFMLYNGMTHKRYENITNGIINNMHNAHQNHDKVSETESPIKKAFYVSKPDSKQIMMVNMHNAYPNHDRMSETEIPMKNNFNDNKHKSNPIMMTYMHHIIRNTPFKLKTHFLKSSKTMKNDDENTEVPNANTIVSDKKDELNTTTEHSTMLEEKMEEKKHHILIGKLQQLPFLKNHLKNHSSSDTDNKIIIRIMSNPKKLEGSYKTTFEHNINHNKSHSDNMASVLNDSNNQPLYIKKDGLSSHSLMENNLKIYPLKAPTIRKALPINYEYKDAPYNVFTDVRKDRMFLPLSKRQKDTQLLQKEKRLN